MVLPVALIVDDDPDLRSYVASRLGSSYRVLEAGSCREALVHLAGTCPDVILLDIGLPDMDGATFFQTIRSRPACADVPILVMTGLSLAAVYPVRLPPRTAYLPKPFTSRMLLGALVSLVAGQNRQPG